MNCQITGYTIAFVIISNCLICTVSGNYAIGNIDDLINKRKYQRRNLLQSFCARRCNRGFGGNVCKCNGFHFAGKRTAGLFEDVAREDTTGVPNMYGLLTDADKVLLKQDKSLFNSEELTQNRRDEVERSLETVLSEVLRGKINKRTYDEALKDLIDTYLEASPEEK